MTIILFPTKPYVRIVSCDVTKTRRVSAAGTAVTSCLSPVRTFFLEYIDHEGCACVCDGATHADALLAASDWAVDGIPVRDHTNDRGRA